MEITKAGIEPAPPARQALLPFELLRYFAQNPSAPAQSDGGSISGLGSEKGMFSNALHASVPQGLQPLRSGKGGSRIRTHDLRFTKPKLYH